MLLECELRSSHDMCKSSYRMRRYQVWKQAVQKNEVIVENCNQKMPGRTQENKMNTERKDRKVIVPQYIWPNQVDIRFGSPD